AVELAETDQVPFGIEFRCRICHAGIALVAERALKAVVRAICRAIRILRSAFHEAAEYERLRLAVIEIGIRRIEFADVIRSGHVYIGIAGRCPRSRAEPQCPARARGGCRVCERLRVVFLDEVPRDDGTEPI